jgi:hypothetical protein
VVQFEIPQALRRESGLCETWSMQTKYEPIVTMKIDNRIVEAECSCGDRLPIPNEVGSAKEQEMTLMAAFGRHMNQKYRQEDTVQTAS